MPLPAPPSRPAAADDPATRHALLESILAASPDHIFVIDRAGRCLYASQAGAQALGHAPEALVGKTASDLGLPPSFVQKLAQEQAVVFATGETVRGEARVLQEGGGLRHFEHTIAPLRDPSGTVTAVVTTARDVTDTRRAQDTLRRSEEDLELAVSAARLGTFFCEWPLDKIYWNETCKAHFFLPPEADIDISLFYSRLHPDDRAPTQAAIERAVSEHIPYDVEYRTMAPDGRMRWINAIGRGYYDAQGQPTRFDGITIDITARKLAEAERDQARREAEMRALELAGVYEREHRIAEALQRSLLLLPPPEALAGLEVETVYQPAWDEAEVGGDYYDIFALENGRLALVVGDVSGKGLEAASRTAEIKFTLRAYLREYPHAVYASAQLTQSVGDLLLVATDGLTEARRGHTFLGGDGLADLARRALGAGTLSQIGQAVLDGAQAFAGGRLHDDACLLLARRLP